MAEKPFASADQLRLQGIVSKRLVRPPGLARANNWRTIKTGPGEL